MAPTCCGSGSLRLPRGPSWHVPQTSGRRVARRVRCAARRSTRAATSARGATVITSTSPSDGIGVPDRAATLEVLRDGTIEVIGRVIGSSNNALFVSVACPGTEPDDALAAIYKPRAGERPLDDFPDGTLARREVAAWYVSEVTGWDIVPPTVLREGPFGEGMVQAYVEPDPAVDVIELITTADPRLRRMGVLAAA